MGDNSGENKTSTRAMPTSPLTPGLSRAKAVERKIPAVIISGKGPGTLGIVRSLGRAEIPVILLVKDAFTPAMHSVYTHKVVISRLTERIRDGEGATGARPPLSLARQSFS